MTFKVGDRVKITCNGLNFSSLKVGEEFVIRQIVGDWLRPISDIGCGVSNRMCELVVDDTADEYNKYCFGVMPSLSTK